MLELSADELRIKELFKEALLELLQEERDTLYGLFAEVIEDLALVSAIQEGELTEPASRAEVFQVLEASA